MGENGEDGKDFNPNESHFSDEELEAALAGFEKEFEDAPADLNADDSAADSGNADVSADAGFTGGSTNGGSTGGSANLDSAGGSTNGGSANLDSTNTDPFSDDDVIGSVANAVDEAMADVVDPSDGFDNELAGLLGNKAKVALIVTRIASADLLAAFCQLSDISAECIGANQGAVAVLKNLDGDAPEAAAKDLTTVVSGMAAVLAVNRADKLEAAMYMHGRSDQSFAPPVLFASTPRFVEDLMLGIVTLGQLKTQGFEVVDSASLDHGKAMQVIANHTRRGRGGRGTRIE
jgi:hypothetical protein